MKTPTAATSFITQTISNTWSAAERNFFGKKVWRVTLSSIFKSMKSDHPVIRELIRADYRFMGNIATKLEELKQAGRLADSFSTDTAVTLIY